MPSTCGGGSTSTASRSRSKGQKKGGKRLDASRRLPPVRSRPSPEGQDPLASFPDSVRVGFHSPVATYFVLGLALTVGTGKLFPSAAISAGDESRSPREATSARAPPLRADVMTQAKGIRREGLSTTTAERPPRRGAHAPRRDPGAACGSAQLSRITSSVASSLAASPRWLRTCCLMAPSSQEGARSKVAMRRS